jgi:hypothetical protein
MYIHRASCASTVVHHQSFLSNCIEKDSLDKFLKNIVQISNFVNVRPVGAELFHADGQTDITKPIVAVRNFANAPKITVSSSVGFHTADVIGNTPVLLSV